LLLFVLQVPPQAAVMVGDDVRDDVGGAMACGMAGVLGELLQDRRTALGNPS
jgi:FMN phosphatase YigB (HAD superfamily)